MRTIGLIGGMNRESSAEYYRLINQQVRERPGRVTQPTLGMRRRRAMLKVSTSMPSRTA